MKMALKEGTSSTRIDAVFSIINSNRSVRSDESGDELQGNTNTQKVKQWGSF